MKYKLKIEKKFTDKYDRVTVYEVGDIKTFAKARGEELLSDPRGLVSLVEKIEKPKKGRSKN